MVIRTISTGTRIVEVLCEVTYGENATQRIKYTGFLDSPRGAEQAKVNAARAYKDLRAMGWKGRSWGDTSGIGSGHEFEAKVLADEAVDGKKYPRVAFPQDIRRLSHDDALLGSAIQSLDAEMSFDSLEAIIEAEEHDRQNERAAR